MRIAVHPRLVEEAVFVACRAREAAGDPAPAQWLRRALDRGYRLPPGPERDVRFERAHGVVFRRLGLADALRKLMEAHPGLAAADGPLRVGPAPGRPLEGMDLHERREEDGRTTRAALVSLLPATLADPPLLALRLHRHAAKVADLLDPAFGWKPGGGEASAARRETVRVRYGAAWDAWTDGRLERRGLPVPVARERAEREFTAAFAAALGEEGAAAAFARLRGAERLTHADLLALARDPAGRGECSPPSPGVPGGLCPFCRFPTHDWYTDPEDLPAAARAGMAASLPSWSPGEGICGQCALLYRSRAPLPVSS